jgi:signal transduction histidine kinase/HAMP domain-containing protein
MKFHLPGLAGRLAIVTGLLVALAVAAVSVYGIGSLRELAAAEGLTRVELAVSAAREALRQNTEDLLTAARILGEREPLRRLLRGSIPDALPPYLTRYCEGAALDGCAIVQDARLIASSGETLDWEQLLVAVAEQGERFLATGVAPGVALAGAQAAVTDHAGVNVVTVRRLDDRFAARLGERVGMQIRIVDYTSFRPGEGPLAILNSDSLSRADAVSAEVDALNAYAASLPVAASTGEIIALLQAVLPTAEVMGTVSEMTRRMLLFAFIIAALATASGIFIGRHWITGVERLTDAARRLGAGDLATSIPVGGAKELAVLGHTLEEMRQNLVDLTSELRRRETEAQAVLGGIVEGVYAVDDARRIRFLNPQAERLLKISASEAIGSFCGDVLKPVRDSQGRRPCDYACPIVQARRVGAAHALEQVEPAPGRQRRVVIASAAPAEGLQVQVLRDETELEAVRRTRDTVLANISHEFRTPLAAQLASIELLRDGLGKMPPEAQRELVLSLERSAQRLTWLIDNLLESVRIESGQLAIRQQDVALGDVIVAARELIGPLIAQRGQRIDVQLLDGVPMIRGDQQRLTQVIVNLVANASKFAPPDSTIRIGARGLPGGGLTFWVDDEGEGPTDPDDTGLFEQFHRSGGEDPDESGLGLGLFIVRSIVERHGGRVTLARTAEARTRAQVELPKEPRV